jgi:hypothetical protein
MCPVYPMCPVSCVSYAGIFAWERRPAAFQIETVAIKWELQHCLKSDVTIYADDIIGIEKAPDIDEDIRRTR